MNLESDKIPFMVALPLVIGLWILMIGLYYAILAVIVSMTVEWYQDNFKK